MDGKFGFRLYGMLGRYFFSHSITQSRRERDAEGELEFVTGQCIVFYLPDTLVPFHPTNAVLEPKPHSSKPIPLTQFRINLKYSHPKPSLTYHPCLPPLPLNSPPHPLLPFPQRFPCSSQQTPQPALRPLLMLPHRRILQTPPHRRAAVRRIRVLRIARRMRDAVRSARFTERRVGRTERQRRRTSARGRVGRGRAAWGGGADGRRDAELGGQGARFRRCVRRRYRAGSRAWGWRGCGRSRRAVVSCACLCGDGGGRGRARAWLGRRRGGGVCGCGCGDGGGRRAGWRRVRGLRGDASGFGGCGVGGGYGVVGVDGNGRDRWHDGNDGC